MIIVIDGLILFTIDNEGFGERLSSLLFANNGKNIKTAAITIWPQPPLPPPPTTTVATALCQYAKDLPYNTVVGYYRRWNTPIPPTRPNRTPNSENSERAPQS